MTQYILWVMLEVTNWKMIMVEQTKLTEWVVWDGLMLFRPHSLDGLAWPQCKESIVAEHLKSLLNHPLCKRISVPQPLTFTLVPPDVTVLKLIVETNVWKFSLAFVWQIYSFILVKKFKTFGYVVVISFPRKFNENFKLVSQQTVEPFCHPTNH